MNLTAALLSLIATIFFGLAGWIGWLVLSAVRAGRYTALLDARMHAIEDNHETLLQQLKYARDKQSETGAILQTLVGKALICEERHGQAIDERGRVRKLMEELQQELWRKKE